MRPVSTKWSQNHLFVCEKDIATWNKSSISQTGFHLCHIIWQGTKLNVNWSNVTKTKTKQASDYLVIIEWYFARSTTSTWLVIIGTFICCTPSNCFWLYYLLFCDHLMCSLLQMITMAGSQNVRMKMYHLGVPGIILHLMWLMVLSATFCAPWTVTAA